LIVNPVAGMGGKFALKGSDDRALVEEARTRGAVPVAPARAVEALRALTAEAAEVELLTYPGDMGETEARAAQLEPVVLGSISSFTTAADTCAAAASMVERGVGLLCFAGGDGTAADILEAIGGRVPVLGIPAGVKMHSAVFALNPRSAGELALRFVRGGVRSFVDAEVMDVDEEALRAGAVSARLHGYLRIPAARALFQSAKTRSGPSEEAAQAGIARYFADAMLQEGTWMIGPGTTTRRIMEALGLEKTVLGVDVVRGGGLLARDADEQTLLELAAAGDARILVTPIGGQGFVFGRGNQQLSASVIERVGPENVVVVATEAKIAALGGRPLLVDTGDACVDAALAGYARVVTGHRREIVYRIAS
jgi:predicted polyphosphate/ATP-dependent NAD kinase